MVTETSCSLSRAKVRVASRDPVSNVECESTRMTDAGRKERVKEEKETGRKEKEDRKERGRIRRKMVEPKSLVGQLFVSFHLTRQGVRS